jgi:hypothetical protein
VFALTYLKGKSKIKYVENANSTLVKINFTAMSLVQDQTVNTNITQELKLFN